MNPPDQIPKSTVNTPKPSSSPLAQARFLQRLLIEAAGTRKCSPATLALVARSWQGLQEWRSKNRDRLAGLCSKAEQALGDSRGSPADYEKNAGTNLPDFTEDLPEGFTEDLSKDSSKDFVESQDQETREKKPGKESL